MNFLVGRQPIWEILDVNDPIALPTRKRYPPITGMSNVGPMKGDKVPQDGRYS